MSKSTLDRITDGRTDLVFDHISEGHAATSADQNGVSLIKWCAYYGDVSAIRFLLANGESLHALGVEWRFSAHLGELVFAPGSHSQKTLLR